MDVRRLQLLARNARFMRQETFQRLVDNVKRDGVLTQLPVARWVGEGAPNLDAVESWEVPSGNHRVKAAIAAEKPEQQVLFIVDLISRERAMGIQLSHNAISGEDDPAVLVELYDEIASVDMRAYSGLDDKTLELMADVQVGALAEANLDFQTLQVLFLPNELARAQAALADALEATKGGDERWLARLEDYGRMLDMLDVAGKAIDVRNVATSLALIIDVFEAHVADLAEFWADDEDRKAWVPAPSVTGWSLPPGAAKTIKQAIDRMIARGDATDRWMALEFMAASYLAEP